MQFGVALWGNAGEDPAVRYKNPNTTALIASLECSLPTLRAEAVRLVREAANDHDTYVAQAESLGVNPRAMYRIRALMGDK